MITRRVVQTAISLALQERSFEDILEDFDLSPEDVFWKLFTLGYIDQELLENLYELYGE